MTTMMIAAAICPRETTKAGSLARGRRATMTTMMIGTAAADTAAGMAIQKVTPKRHGPVADNRPTNLAQASRDRPGGLFAFVAVCPTVILSQREQIFFLCVSFT
jgi:hypothetical protein